MTFYWFDWIVAVTGLCAIAAWIWSGFSTVKDQNEGVLLVLVQCTGCNGFVYKGDEYCMHCGAKFVNNPL